MRKRWAGLVGGLLTGLLSAAPLQMDPALWNGAAVELEIASGVAWLNPEHTAWLATSPLTARARVGDFIHGSISFQIFLPADLLCDEWLVEAGDFTTNQFPVLRIMLTAERGVRANHFNFARQDGWLSGVEAPAGSVPLARWCRVEYRWGAAGQQLLVDGVVMAATADTEPVSWPYEVRFGTLPACFAAARLAASPLTAPPDAPTVDWSAELSGKSRDLLNVLRELPAWSAELTRLEARLGAMPYERARLALLRYFVPRLLFAEEKAKAAGTPPGPDIRQPEAAEIDWLLAELPRLRADLQAIAAGEQVPLQSPPVRPSRASLQVKDGAFWQDGRPVFLVGTQNYFPLNQALGFNMTGWTFGPGWESVGEGQVKHGGDAHYQAAVRAGAEGQFWDELYSAHVEPGWLKEKYPEVAVGMGFMNYDPTHPAARAMNEAVLRSILPEVWRAANFAFLDLMNEPAFNGRTVGAAAAWQEWVKREHRSLDALNTAWRADYGDWMDIPIPDFVHTGWSSVEAQQIPVDPAGMSRFIDWTNFNCARVAGWFEEMRDIAHDVAPGVLTYVKVIANPPYDLLMGCDPIAVARLSDLNGSDAWWVYQGASTELSGGSDLMSGGATVRHGDAVGWQYSLLHYDLLTSANPGAPVVNAEDHLFADGYTPLSATFPEVPPGHWDRVIPPEHFYAGLWQQAIHGKGLSLLWTSWPRHNLIDRPSALQACSQAVLDLNRLSREVRAVASAATPLRILYAPGAMIRDGANTAPDSYWQQMLKLYEALSLRGIAVRFVLESDLRAGLIPDAAVILAPFAVQLHPDAARTLRRAQQQGVALWSLGEAVATRDSYDLPMPDDAAITWDSALNWDTLPAALSGAGVEPAVRVTPVDASGTARVEWREVPFQAGRLLNLCSYGTAPVTVCLSGPAAPTGPVTDLISGAVIQPQAVELAPETVLLLYWSE